jgi:DNA topoisomerase I
VKIEKKRLQPEDKGRLVTAFLESFFQRYVEYDFTAGLEEKLDLISDAKLNWKDVLRDFWQDFAGAIDGTKELRVSQVLDGLNEILGPFIFPSSGDGNDPRKCPNCGQGRLGLKIGKFGAFVGCSNYPECRFTRQFTDSQEKGEDGETPQQTGDRALGEDPETGLTVWLKNGRFGPYVQLGEIVETPKEKAPKEKGKKAKAEKPEKPKRSSIPKGYNAATLDLQTALKLLSLPRELGKHPETGKPITAALGRFGPFIAHDGKYANLSDAEEVFTVGLNRAVSLLAEPKKGPARAGQQALKALGDHPELGGPVQLFSGRYGPYVKHGKVNATIPKGTEPEALTLEEAVRLIAARAESGKTAKPTKGKSRKAKGQSATEATT